MRFIKWKDKAIAERNKRYTFYVQGTMYCSTTAAYCDTIALSGVFVPNLKGRMQLLYWAVCCGHVCWL